MEKQLLQRSSAEFNAVNAKGFFIQPKLTINQPNDVYEQEADAMADKVMRMEQPGVQLKPLPIITSVQKKCEHCDKEKEMQRKEISGEEKTADSNLENYVGGLNSGGQALPNEVRNFYEPRFGYDFGNVKLHTGTVAAKSAQSINALAYTSGNNIVFNDGQYSPNTESGKKLLSHELTHVVQQTNSIQPYRKTEKQDKTKNKLHSFNFGRSDTATLKEDSFDTTTDIETKPWIKLITVELKTKKKDVNNVEMWTGDASVEYYDNAAKWANFTFTVAAGSAELGKTSSGNFKVTRIEGDGYNSGKYSDDADTSNREGPRKRYSKDLSANMSFAVFYHGGEALHAGPLDWSSHGCVHVDWSDTSLIQQINYHSVIGLTKVVVKPYK